MGIDYQAAIVVGLPRDELEFEGCIEGKDFYEWVEDNDMEMVSPYYDAMTGVVGFVYKQSLSRKESVFEWDQASVDYLKDRFKELTSKDASVYLTPNIW